MTEIKTLHSASTDGALKIMLASNKSERFAPLAAGLWNDAEPELYQAESVSEVMDLLAARSIQIVVVDEELHDMKGIDLVRMLAQKHPFVNCLLVSSLPADEFHEQTEGLGVLMQLPSPPGMDVASKLLSHFAEILSLKTT